VENMMNRLSDLSGKETGKIRATSVPAKPRTPNLRLHTRIHAIFLPDNTTTLPPQSDKLRAESDKKCHRTKSQFPPPTTHARPRDCPVVGHRGKRIPPFWRRPRKKAQYCGMQSAVLRENA
jgi:hypothetical protein